MIVAKLYGGMGNQMFQYAFARALSLKNNIPFTIDKSFLSRRDMYEGFVYRDYDLDLFNIEENFIDNTEQIVHINESIFNFSEFLVEYIGRYNTRDVLLDGYWQSPKYFLGFDEQIKSDFQLRDGIETSDDENIINMISLIKNSNSVLINIRRADFLNNNFHGVMGADYINKAVDIIKTKVQNPHYFIFSDDIEWCKDNIKLDNMTIVDHYYKGDRFGYYLQLMKMCKHFIIPNSSFAWWAAWLSESHDKTVIAPKLWIADTTIDTSDLIPDNWIRI